jgi:nucleoside 2-deoxyribosyltransferase
MKIYLAGPISHTSYGEATDWRQEVAERLSEHTCLSPMRGKSYLSSEECIADSYEGTPLSCSRGIITRDHWDSSRCDLMLVNLLGAERVSIGTMIELGWAYAYRKPVIVVMEEGGLHDHAMVREIIGFWVRTVDQAIHTVKMLAAE